MILITGGRYQGKLSYAQSIACPENTIIDNCDDMIRQELGDGETPENVIAGWRNVPEDSILILNDVSMGIVPIDKNERVFRETVGKVGVMLAENADSIYRVFCGIPMKIK